MKRFTICGLRAFVDYVNETVPKIEGKHFAIKSAYGHHRIILKGDGGEYGTAAENTHYKGGTPRECVHGFSLWLLGSPCPRDAYNKIVLYIVNRNI
jgi:hypothetical protein